MTITSEMFGWDHKKNVLYNLIGMLVLSLPCALGFNVWSFIQPMGAGTTIQDLEDFIVSNNLLPLGSLFYVLFCTAKNGWGWDAFLEEANAGNGIAFSHKIKFYCSVILPLIILIIFIQGYITTLFG
jgi:NSS family neurotransmitter:Na+ symporter